MVFYEEGYKYGIPDDYVEKMLEEYRDGKIGFRKLNSDLSGAGDNLADLLIDNSSIFEERVAPWVFSRAVLDGGILYSDQIVKRYLKVGLSRRVLLNWLKKNLRYEWFINEGAECEDIDYDYVVLELCQILAKNGFTPKEIESVLDSLDTGARVFFLMVTDQYGEYLDIGVNPSKYIGRASKYPYFTEKIKFEELSKLPVPHEHEKKLVRKVFSLYPLKDIIGSFYDGEDAFEYLVSCGVRTDVIARKYVAEIGYDNPTKDEALFGYCLSDRVLAKAVGLHILDHIKIKENWEKRNPFAPFYEFSDSPEDESGGGSNMSDHVDDSPEPQPCCYSRICRDSGYDDEEYMDLMSIF